MLHLRDELLIGRGTERYCYRHPEDPTRCVKVSHNFKNNKQQNQKDYEYFTRLERRGIDWSHLPRCHGWVETDQGKGLVFDLLQDESGKPLERLDTLLSNGQLEAARVESALEDLHAYLQVNLVFTSDLRASNIVCDPHEAPIKLFLIDGIGDRDFIKVATYIKPLAKAKIERQWSRFMKRVEKQHQL
ncbi:PhoP regulatory network protein YrbL [Modicisalibacter ilicicola DSM 19980]|uniref:PhoP regulatory network protein YrbL n=1 Tax=Modicisalibacter ilicicola DSM 19980 TaxID=1121942 RepID=A0A1M5EN12_9GAMM|nr:YrbL family protein [Halomonas ilicicola]SHF80566.1 PhoP regulatory network protein YrbL [Halomonas ilicicola DSM 19980]